ncbi:MAG TPA: toll/interleukin-1 receptor domain-containing protein [Nitrosomonas sp.]|nr:hypothetical protein [Nitrosomonas nitrosa]HNP26327.1 toll/interleukin-1 receptor domain-containing protein [Nitrosomonas sp.]
MTHTSLSSSPSSPVRDVSVFISYALADDLKPPFDDTTQGWVTFFWSQLRFELTTRGAKQAKLWLDRYEIDPAEAFTPKIEQALIQARLLIAIFSENWRGSHWCRQEVDFFSDKHKDASNRIVPVYKSELSREHLPDLIQEDQSRVGYCFFESDASGKTHEFYWRGLKDQDAYYDLIKRIALFIIDRLDNMPSAISDKLIETSLPSTDPQKTIFVAAAASDLKDARQRLVNDLTAAGFAVVPNNETLPETNAALEKVLSEALSQAEYAVNLIGEGRGVTVEGGMEPIVDHQVRLAREISLPRVYWVPRWLPNQAGDKRDPFEVMKRFDGLQAKEEIFNGEVTDLSQWLRERFQSTFGTTDNRGHSGKNEFNRILIAAAHVDDEELAIDFANQVQGCGFVVQPYFIDDDIPSGQELCNTLVLILWGSAGGADLEFMLDKLATSPEIVCLRLPGGDEKAKRRFFRQNVLLEKLDALPVNRDETKNLLDALGIPLQMARASEES